MNQPQIIIACGAKKLSTPAQAQHLYTGPLFTASLTYAKHFYSADKILILSAKHGLLCLNQEIEPYDVRLNCAGSILPSELAKQLDALFLGMPPIHFLGSRDYRAHLLCAWQKRYGIRAAHRCAALMQCPLEGMGIGQRIQFLQKAIGEEVTS